MLQRLTLQLRQGISKKRGKSFRKSLVLDYKKGDRHSHKNPHAILLNKKDKLIKQQKWNKINQLQRNSLRPFGKFTRKGFVFDKQKLPFYDIPNLEGFDLKPYVEFNAPRLSLKLINHQQQINQQKIAQISQKTLKLGSIYQKKSCITKVAKTSEL